MVRHIVTWNLKAGLTRAGQIGQLETLKGELEQLKEIIPGIVSIQLIIDPIEGSTADLLLDSCFESGESLAAYQVHPAHRKLAVVIGEMTCNRTCMDYRG